MATHFYKRIHINVYRCHSSKQGFRNKGQNLKLSTVIDVQNFYKKILAYEALDEIQAVTLLSRWKEKIGRMKKYSNNLIRSSE